MEFSNESSKKFAKELPNFIDKIIERNQNEISGKNLEVIFRKVLEGVSENISITKRILIENTKHCKIKSIKIIEIIIEGTAE